MLLTRHALRTSLVMMLICLTGCPGSVYMWEVITESTRKPPSFKYHATLERNLWLSLKRTRHRVFMAMRSASPYPSSGRCNRLLPTCA